MVVLEQVVIARGLSRHLFTCVRWWAIASVSLALLLLFFFLPSSCLLNCLYLIPWVFFAFLLLILSPIPLGDSKQVTEWGQPSASHCQPTMPNSIVLLLNIQIISKMITFSSSQARKPLLQTVRTSHVSALIPELPLLLLRGTGWTRVMTAHKLVSGPA